jgi:hypothetical protein
VYLNATAALREATMSREALETWIGALRADDHFRALGAFRSWEDFCATPAPHGLGYSPTALQGLIDARPTAAELDARDAQRQRPAHRPRKTDNNVNGYSHPEGNAAAGALRRLRKDRPDLHARVLAGELSPHAAAVQAGFRPRTITLPLDVERAGATLRRHFAVADRARLAALLLADGDP